ncbi:PIN domain-containing protein [Sulfurimonas sp. HSL3-7]|uniref:PIN domain-containing protein n=1 Tax=Sulfonitrofixus jiaomeiensis TaxID=3131938 RepID=UPI0031F8C4DA
MMANRYNPSNIRNISDKKIFFDANVLIYLFWASTSSSWEEKYARLYSKLNAQDSKFVLDFIVISEFINRAIKIEYKNYLESYTLIEEEWPYKKYRNSEDGQKALEDIYLTVTEDIFREFEVVEKSYSIHDLTLMCTVDTLDFSDKAIVKICDENQFVLLTNDTDFKDIDIDILSCHRDIC